MFKIRKSILAVFLAVVLLFGVIANTQAGFTTSLTTSLTTALTHGLTQIEDNIVANWILPLLQLGQTEGTSSADNKVGWNWLNGTNLYGAELADQTISGIAESPPNSTVTETAEDITLHTDGTNVQFAVDPLFTVGDLVKLSIDFTSFTGSGTLETVNMTPTRFFTVGTGVQSVVGELTSTTLAIKRTPGAVLDCVILKSSLSVRKVNSLTLVEIPDSSDVGIQNGLQYDSTAKTYSFTLSDGTSVAKLITPTPQTTNGSVPTLDPLAMVDRVNDETIADGDIRRVLTTEGLYVWVLYNGAGTADSSLPTTSISDIGGAAITDNDTEYLVKGLQSATGLFSGLAATNEILQSRDPDNAAWTQRGTFSAVQDLVGADGQANTGWTLSGIDTASVGDIFQGTPGLTTATRYEPSFIMRQISTSGVITIVAPQSPTFGDWDVDLSLLKAGWQSVDRNNPAVSINTEYQTVAGTSTGFLIKKKSGTGTLSVGYFDSQLEKGEVSTPIIPTTDHSGEETRTATVTSTPISATRLVAAGGYFYAEAEPLEAGQTAVLLSSYTDANNSLDLLMNANDITFRKRVSTTDYDAVISYTHTANTRFGVMGMWDSTGMEVSVIAVGGTFPTVETHANTDSAVLGTSLQTGSQNDLLQPLANMGQPATFSNRALLLTYLAKLGYDVSNL